MPLRCHPLTPAFIAIFIWLLVGTLAYYLVGNEVEEVKVVCNGTVVTESVSWTFAQSFYYAIQAGLSVGFGVLAETKEVSRLFTVFYILSGSAFMIGALVFFIQLALTRQTSWQSAEEQRLARFSSRIQADGYGGFNLRELHELLICYPDHMRALCLRLNTDYKVVREQMQAFTKASLQERAKSVDEVLKEACVKLEEFRDKSVSIPDLLALHQQEASTPQRFKRFISSQWSIIKQVVAIKCWVILGIVYLCVAEKASFITGLYFAVSTISTAGLYGISSTSSDAAFWFVGFFCIIGVPLYGFVLGSYANILVEQHSSEQTLDTIHQQMDKAEVEFLEHLVKAEHKEKFDFADYVEIQLLRLGTVDRAFLRQLRDDFNKLDTEGNGKVPPSAFLTESQKKSLENETAEPSTAGPETETAQREEV